MVVQHGLEVAVTSMGETPEGRNVICLRVYDEWGRVLSSRHVLDTARLISLPRGFAVVSDAGTTILTRSGRRAVAVH